MIKQLSKDRDYILWVLLHQTRSAVFKVREKDVSKYGLTAAQSAVLFVISAVEGKATPAKIARWLFREAHSVAGLLNRMEKQGLIRKTKDLDKKNLIRVTLTEKGEQLCYLVSERGTLNRILAGLPEEQRQQLESILHILLDRALKELALEVNLPSISPR